VSRVKRKCISNLCAGWTPENDYVQIFLLVVKGGKTLQPDDDDSDNDIDNDVKN